jgi:hypothetical protein
MQPDAPLIVELEPNDVFADAVKPVFLPWSGQFVTIMVPAGTPDGTVLRIPGLGLPAVAGGPPQDGHVQVRVRPATAPAGPLPSPSPYGPPQGVAVPPPQGVGAGPTRRNRIIGGVVAAVLLATCCGVARLFSGDDSGTDSAPNGRPLVGAPAPGTAPVAPEKYQALLTKADATLLAGFRTLGTARSPKGVKASAAGLTSALDAQSKVLLAVAPPTAVASAHSDLVAALSDLGGALPGTGSNAVCLGPAATSKVSQAAAADRVRAAARALATADPAKAYKFGAFVPKETKDANRRLGNGTFIKRGRGGSGELEIANGSRDAVISIVRNGAKTPTTRVYVRGGKSFTVSGIKDGTYQIFMTDGQDWDPELKAFSRGCAFQRFDDPLKFTTTSGSYSIWKITVTKSVGGNASSSEVDPDAFPAG